MWLNEDFLTPYDYWQFWRNTDDRDVKIFLNYFTGLETEKINELFNKETNINKLKILFLANETTKNFTWKKSSRKS